MKTNQTVFQVFCVLLAVATTAQAAEAPAPAVGTLDRPATVAQPNNPLSFADGKIVFDLDWRVRAERRGNDRDFNTAVDCLQDTEALLSRFRLGLTLKPLPWLRLYGQGQDARETWSNRGREPNVNSAQGNATFDLRQGYLALSDYTQCPVGLSLGRQVFTYGDSRFIADSGWGNCGRSFDGAKLRYQQDDWWVEAFWASVVIIERDALDKRKDDEYVAGAYLSNQGLSGHILDLYGFYLDSDSGSVEGQYTTVGARMASKKSKDNPWDHTAELAVQYGTRAGGGDGALDIVAMVAHADAGYTFRTLLWQPRIGVSYDYASGDGDRTDGDSTTFRTPYTSSHSWYGRQDIVGLANIHNPRLILKVKPTNKLGITAEYNIFWLADTADFAYGSNGLTPVRRTTPDGQDVRDVGASSHLGHEFDLVADYAVTKTLMLHAGVSWFFAGSYLSDTGPADTGTYYYLQTTVKF